MRLKGNVEIKDDAFIFYNHKFDQVLPKALEDRMERLANPLLALRAIELFRDEPPMCSR